MHRYNFPPRVSARRASALVRREANLKKWNSQYQIEKDNEEVERKVSIATKDIANLKAKVSMVAR